ncbi:hypothetical protein [Nostoc sp. NZL]|nr:hypothetical protein [Nostoc sp. NZL]
MNCPYLNQSLPRSQSQTGNAILGAAAFLTRGRAALNAFPARG